MTTLIEVINHGPIRELRLARPPVNALDTDLCRQLIHAIELAMAEDAHGIVLSGSERIFTGGMDVPHLLSHGDAKHKLLDTWNAVFGAVRTLAESRLPVRSGRPALRSGRWHTGEPDRHCVPSPGSRSTGPARSRPPVHGR